MSKPFLPYGRQTIDDADIAAVVEVLKSDWMTQGPKIPAFEKAVAEKVGARHGVAVATGTAALHCACVAAGVGPGDEIVTAPITFAASGNCALFQGADVRFADIRPDTYCMDPSKLEAAITKRTKAIIPVDFTGQPADMDEIMAIGRKHGIPVIEDAAQSLGATYKGRPVGSIADMTTFSFHPVKHIAMGEGGLIATNDDRFEKILRLFRTHGISNVDAEMQLADQAADNEALPKDHQNPGGKAGWYYEMQMLGYNYRVTDMQCALGLSQLSKLDGFVKRRRAIAERYSEAFSKSPLLITPYQTPNRMNSWHLYMIRMKLSEMTKTRRQVFDAMRAAGIGVHVHHIPVHLLPYYRSRFGYKRGDFPVAEAYYDSAMTLPLFPAMTDADADRVIETLLENVA
jgi:perosamine synthetase